MMAIHSNRSKLQLVQTHLAGLLAGLGTKANILPSASGSTSILALILTLLAVRHYGSPSASTISRKAGGSQGKIAKNKPKEYRINKESLQRLARLLRVMVPGLLTPEAGFLMGVAGLLVARTYLDLVMLNMTTSIERAIVQRNRPDFTTGILRFMRFVVPLSLVNSLIKYGKSELALRFRQRLTEHIMGKYMGGQAYYSIANLDSRVTNADQSITQDVQLFAESTADLYSNICKPLLDMAVYIRRLSAQVDAAAPVTMIAYLSLTAVALTSMRRPTAAYTASVQHQEGVYRFVNSRLLTHAEEVAFYGGGRSEAGIMAGVFQDLINTVRRSQQFRFSMAVVDTLAAKYLATAVGYVVVSRPFLDLSHPRHLHSTPGDVYKDYHTSGRMMINLSAALGRLVLSTRELTRLSAFSARVTSLIDVIDDCNRGAYHHPRVAPAAIEEEDHEAFSKTDSEPVAEDGGGLGYQEEGGAAESEEVAGESSAEHRPASPSAPLREASVRRGSKRPRSESPAQPRGPRVVECQDCIEFVDVPLVTPNGDTLVRSISLRVERGMNVLVAGPNGCGKSSLFRVLGGLWPLAGGTLMKPASSRVFYVPQRPYLTLGTLRDQVTYPHTRKDMQQGGATDESLLEVLREVQLAYLVDREGGWDSVRDWADVLSGGEKQRLAMSRIFYHRPDFAVLDECTSAVSVDVEGAIYTMARQMGITLFTVSHRRSLWKYHEYLLMFDGRGGYTFSTMDQQEVFGS